MNQSKYKILIVENNPSDRELITRILNNMDKHFEVKSVGSYREAQEEIQKVILDLILLDIYLPDKDGFNFLQELHENGYEDIPVILVSTFFNEKDKFKGLELGATDFINKPIATEDIKVRIAVQLRLKKIMDDQKWATQKTNEGIKLLYKELEKKNKQLEQLDELKDDFINNVSHELRTPLTIIRESISQITDGLFGEVNEKQNKYLNKSLMNIDRLKKIIEDLLDISKIEKGKLEVFKENVDMVELIEDVVANFTIKAQNKGLEIKANISQERMKVLADKEKIIQVLTNLVGNACKFTDKGCIEISAVLNATHVECSIQDTGIGIASQDLPRLFSKFDQISRQAGPGEKGTGLGLAITKGIVELHDGQIHVESVLGKGTKVTFTLPKYTISEENFQILLICLKENMKKYHCYSVLAFRSKDFEGKFEEKVDELLSHWQVLIKKQLYRQSDQAVKGKDAVYVILPDTDKDDAMVVAYRIHKIIEGENGHELIEGFKGFSFNIVTYPRDGLTENELITKLGINREDI